MIKANEEYTYLENARASYNGTSARWMLANDIERLAIKYKNLKDSEMEEFKLTLEKLEELEKNGK